MDTLVEQTASLIRARHIVALLLSIFGIWSILVWIDYLAKWYQHIDQSWGKYGTDYAYGQDYVLVLSMPIIVFIVLYSALRLARGK